MKISPCAKRQGCSIVINMRKFLFYSLIATAIVLCQGRLCADEPAFTKDASQKPVASIEIQGNKNVSPATILSKIKTHTNETLSQDTLNDDIKKLYATGFFTDVSIDLQDVEGGVKVVFIVKEKPIIEGITFAGNKVIKKAKLESAMKSKADEILDRKKLKDDVAEMKSLYDKKGFVKATVDYAVDVDEESNMAKVKVNIDEGGRLKIKLIRIDGNEAFPDKKILKLMQTKRDTFFSSGYLKEDVLEEDVEKIKSFYENAGYVDVKADKEIEYDDARKKITVIIKIQEGKKYFIGDIKIEGNLVFSREQFKGVLKNSPGSVFSPDNLKSDLVRIQGFYFEKGYIFAEVKYDTLLNGSTGKVDVVYTITENEIAYVDKINIKGNTKTRDMVIRRELKLSPGERFNGKKIERSKEKLYNLGFFEEVTFDTEPTNLPSKKDLVVSVKETKTGEFSFGGGFSSVDKIVAFVEVAQRNFDITNFPTFTGAGQDMRFRGEFGSVRQNFVLSFTEPWIFGKPMSFGVDLFSTSNERSRRTGQSYDEERQGFDFRLGKDFGEYLKGGLTYKFEGVDITNVLSTASADLRAEEGDNNISSMAAQLTRDTRDSIYNPMRGNMTTVIIEGAGGPFGGDKNFSKYQGESGFYFTTFERLVLELKGRAGIVNSFGGTGSVPIYERFFAGGANTIRGYQERRVGPRDPGTNDPIGGDAMGIFNAEATYPVMQYLKGAVFYDMGNIWAKSSDILSGDFKSGAGVGVRVKTPIGPVKLDFGIPVNPDSGEKRKGRFHFNVSRGF